MSRLVRRPQFLVAITVLMLGASMTSAQEGQKVCAIPAEAKMEDAKTTFAKITAVFRHPRCINCHGAQNPFSSDTKHAGGTYEVVTDPNGFVRNDKTFAACETCHGDLPGWKMAPDSMSFVGKDDVALCKLLKRELFNAEGVIDHFTTDLGGTRFIEVGFKGTRGLNEQGQALVEHYRPEPIEGMSQGQLISLARQWLSDIDSLKGNAIGGDIRSDCGCVPHHYALQVHNQVSMDVQGVHWETGYTPDPLIRLVFDDKGTFHSEMTTASLPGAGTTGPCSLNSGGTDTLSAEGRLVDGRIKGTINIATSNNSARLTCPKGFVMTGVPGGAEPMGLDLNAVVGEQSSEGIPDSTGVTGGTVRISFWVKIVQID
jgi:hypothetical protein